MMDESLRIQLIKERAKAVITTRFLGAGLFYLNRERFFIPNSMGGGSLKGRATIEFLMHFSHLTWYLFKF